MRLQPLLAPLATLLLGLSCGPDDIPAGDARGVHARPQRLEGEKWYGTITHEYHQWHRYDEPRTGCISGHVSSTEDELRSTTVGVSGDEIAYVVGTSRAYKRVSQKNDCTPPECGETEVTTKTASGSGTAEVVFSASVEEGVGRFSVEPQGEILARLAGETEYRTCLDSRTSTTEESLDVGVILSGESRAEPGSKPGTFVFQGGHSQEGVLPGAERAEWTETTRWYLTNNPEELIVEVEVVNYDNWRPRGSLISEMAGSHVEVRATLRRVDGGPPGELAQRFTFELAEVSNIPGVAMNYPPPPHQQDGPDLMFDPAVNPGMTLNPPEYSVAKTQEGEYDSASVAVGAYDWGAHGLILVTAKLKNGRRIVGRLKGTTESRIRLPQRGPSSLVADVWKREVKAASQPDDFDEEGTADREGHTGDGLTLFEEYRGFIIRGEWVSGDPVKRDFFVYNLMNDMAEPGINLYANASGLKVHEIRTQDETGKDRVINIHRHPKESLHRVDQHLVKLVQFKTNLELPFTRTSTGRPTVPKNVIQVEIPDDFTRLGSTFNQVPGKIPMKQFDSTIAHELGHASTIHHHGDSDLREVTWKADGSDIAEVAATGVTKPLRIFEDTPAMTELFISSTQLPVVLEFVSQIGGEHSGDTGCLMRFFNAKAMVSVTDPTHRLVPTASDPDPIGQNLCTSRRGTGINAPGRLPQPRHGDASPNRGNCLHQVCVNDFFDNHASR